MKKFLIKKNIVKTEAQADALLVVIIIACLIFIFSRAFGSSRPQVHDLNEDMTMEENELLEVGDPNQFL